MTAAPEAGQWQTPAEERMAAAVRAGGGGMSRAGQWRWCLTGPRGTIIIAARGKWPHRKLRPKIREATGISLHADSGRLS